MVSFLFAFCYNLVGGNAVMKKTKISDKVYGILFICWFLLSIVLAGVSQNEFVVLIDIGQIFIIFGIIILIRNKDDIKNLNDMCLFLPVIIGTVLIVVAILLYFKTEKEIIENIWKLGLSFSFLFAGFLSLGLVVIKRKKMKSDKYVLTHGEIIGLNTSYDGYAPIIHYKFDGKDYKYESHNFYNVKVLSVGDIIDIKVNLANPKEIIFKEPGEWILIVLGIIFVIIFILSIIFMIIQN